MIYLSLPPQCSEYKDFLRLPLMPCFLHMCSGHQAQILMVSRQTLYQLSYRRSTCYCFEIRSHYYIALAVLDLMWTKLASYLCQMSSPVLILQPYHHAWLPGLYCIRETDLVIFPYPFTQQLLEWGIPTNYVSLLVLHRLWFSLI